MKIDFGYALNDGDFYTRPERAARLRASYLPALPPSGWEHRTQGIWTLWNRPGLATPAQGWKVHVSARFDRAQHVLDTVAAACFAEGVPFKHLAAELYFLYLHNKHGPRVQSGKFCACYPADVETARRLMDRLANALADEEGPFILTDRRYRDSRTVHYRYGAFQPTGRLLADGSRELTIRDQSGANVPDERSPRFVLPAGLTDPFATEPAEAPDGGPVTLGGFEITAALRQSNAGGAYRGTDPSTGDPVFMKEARGHNGLHWDAVDARTRLRHEYEVLGTLQELEPGVAPAPLAHFTEWENDFLVTEFVQGQPLNGWSAQHTPIITANTDPAAYARYYDHCREVLDQVAAALARLHRHGYVFGDINPANVLITDDRVVRLIDFEATTHASEAACSIGTPGFAPTAEPDPDDRTQRDRYGLSALALYLLWPLNHVAPRNPAALDHLRADLERFAPVPDDLWDLATEFVAPPPRLHTTERLPSEGYPTPEQRVADPGGKLAWLRDRIVDDLLEIADVDDPDSVFPTVPRGLTTNTLCVAYGTAGVVHALHSGGHPTPPAVVDRLRRDALAAKDDLGPGLHVGTAGIGWVLGEVGLHDEAEVLLKAASDHPLTLLSSTLGEGLAGVGLAWLAAYEHSGEAAHLDHALRAADELLRRRTDLTGTLGPDDATGLLHGRPGIALFLHYASRFTDDPRYSAAGLQLLHDELDRAIELPDGALSFRDNARATRAMPYLFIGSAGMGFVTARYLSAAPDERLAAALPRITADARKTCAVQAGLYCGIAGLGLYLADLEDMPDLESLPDLEGLSRPGELPERSPTRADAAAVAAGLFKYAVPVSSGVRFHGDQMMRMSAELYSGSAGVLLFLDRYLTGRPDAFFTLDAATRSATRLAPAAHLGSGAQ